MLDNAKILVVLHFGLPWALSIQSTDLLAFWCFDDAINSLLAVFPLIETSHRVAKHRYCSICRWVTIEVCLQSLFSDRKLAGCDAPFVCRQYTVFWSAILFSCLLVTFWLFCQILYQFWNVHGILSIWPNLSWCRTIESHFSLFGIIPVTNLARISSLKMVMGEITFGSTELTGGTSYGSWHWDCLVVHLPKFQDHFLIHRNWPMFRNRCLIMEYPHFGLRATVQTICHQRSAALLLGILSTVRGWGRPVLKCFENLVRVVNFLDHQLVVVWVSYHILASLGFFLLVSPVLDIILVCIGLMAFL